MKKIVIGGQIDKDLIEKKVKEIAGDRLIVEVKNDLDAAMAMKNGEYDYYLGACITGGGGALAMAIALVGRDLCSTVSMPGVIKDDEYIVNEVKSGKKAFGFTAQHIDQVVPVIIKAILEEKK